MGQGITRIVADTASDLTFAEAAAMNVTLVSIPVMFDGELFPTDINADLETFYTLLAISKELPKTSQPTPADYLDVFAEAEAVGDDVLVITLSSGLSGTYETACSAASGYKRVFVYDSGQATLTLRLTIEYAVRLRDEGLTAPQIVEKLVAIRDRLYIYGALDTLTYLKKGGRVPPALALLGNAIHLKPIIVLANKKLEQYAKTRGTKQAWAKLNECLANELPDHEWPVYFGYSRDREAGASFMREATARFGLQNTRLYEIGGVIGAHLGPGVVAVAYVKQANSRA